MNKQKIILLSSLLFFSFSLKKKKTYLPPGTVQITETFFADETEISNLSWLEYEYWTMRKYGPGSKQHLEVLPDTSVWTNKKSYSAPYFKYYYRHVAYKNYPVVGISHEQAIAFCKWRSDRVKEFYSIRHKKALDIEYRLPTQEEWELLAMSGEIAFNHEGKNEKGLYVLNCFRNDSTDNYLGSDVTAPVYSFWKNRFGLFNCLGNVAEMIGEKGISKGGSWRHELEECRVGKDIPYSAPEAWLGFRCVCVVRSR